MSDERKKDSGRFMGWRDMVITPAIQVVLFAGALVPALALRSRFGLGGLETGLLTYVFLNVDTLLFLGALRRLFPGSFVAGVYSARRNPWRCYVAFNLNGFLLITNLSLLFVNGLIPPPLRAIFYLLLGAKVGKGIAPINGTITDPHMLELGAGAMIGAEAIILGHGLNTVGGEDVLVLGKVTIGAGAVIGARAVVMPGVTIGEHAMVAAMSYVPMGTKIPAYEAWGGYPAKKLGSVAPRGALATDERDAVPAPPQQARISDAA